MSALSIGLLLPLPRARAPAFDLDLRSETAHEMVASMVGVNVPVLACWCRVELAPGVEYVRTADVKDQIELSGNDIQAVSMTGEGRWLL